MKNKSRLAVLLLSLLTLPIITALFMGCPGEGMEVKAPRVKREVADLKDAESDKFIPSGVVANIRDNLVGHAGGVINHVHMAKVDVGENTHYHVLVMTEGPSVPDKIVLGFYFILDENKRLFGDGAQFTGRLDNEGGLPYLHTSEISENNHNIKPMKMHAVDSGVVLRREKEEDFLKSTDAEIIGKVNIALRKLGHVVNLRGDDAEYKNLAGTYHLDTVSGGANKTTQITITIKNPDVADITIDNFINEKQRETKTLDGTRIFEFGRVKIVARDEVGAKFTFEPVGENVRLTINRRYAAETSDLYTRQKTDLVNDQYVWFVGEFETIVGANSEQATMKIEIIKSQQFEIVIDYKYNLDGERKRQTAVLDGERFIENGKAKIVAKDKIAGKDEYIYFTFELTGKDIVNCIIKHPSDTKNRVSVYARKKDKS